MLFNTFMHGIHTVMDECKPLELSRLFVMFNIFLREVKKSNNFILNAFDFFGWFFYLLVGD